MKFLLTVSASLAIATLTFADDKTSYEQTTKGERDRHGYKTTTSAETTDAAGTTRKTESEEKAAYKSDGTEKLSGHASSTTDPKGLGNKQTEKTKFSQETEARGGLKAKSTSSTESADGMAFDKNKEFNRNVRADGSVEDVTEEKVVADPSGPLNKTTGKVTTKTVTRPDGSSATRQTKEINGDTVSDTAR